MARCQSVYGGAVIEPNRPIRCEQTAGHSDRHSHSFAARYWWPEEARDSAPESAPALAESESAPVGGASV